MTRVSRLARPVQTNAYLNTEEEVNGMIDRIRNFFAPLRVASASFAVLFSLTVLIVVETHNLRVIYRIIFVS